MVRTQIQLTEEQAERLKRAASERGVSMAAVIRQAIDREVVAGGQPRRSRARSVVGRFRSGRGDIAERHDRELEQIYEA